MNRLAGFRVAITGGAGFIGSHLTERVVAEGAAHVVVVDDLSTGSVDNLAACPSVELVEADIASPPAARAVGGCDLVFHLAVRNVRASIKHPAPNFEVNANGTLALLEAMRSARNGRFVYISSSEVYGIPADDQYAETVSPQPTTVYGAGKLAGELLTLAYHRTYGVDTRVIRPFNNYGPRSHFEGDSGEVIPKFILRALAGRALQIHGDGTQTRDFMFVEDTARWLIELALSDRFADDVVNIGSGQDVSIAALAGLVLDATGSSSPVVHGAPRPGDLPRLLADTAKIRSAFAFDLPTDLTTGLRRTIDHFARQDVEKLLAQELEQNWR